MLNNLTNSCTSKAFYLWVDPGDPLVKNNIGGCGYAGSNAVMPESNKIEDSFLFIPNQKPINCSITPYQNNIIKRLLAEYRLETYRTENYPSRMHAIFLIESEADAIKYQQLHEDHVKNRILIKGMTTGSYIYSKHDSGWFDYLCLNPCLGEEGIEQFANCYWNGVCVNAFASLCIPFNQPWTQEPSMEILFYGTLQFSDEEKEKFYVR